MGLKESMNKKFGGGFNTASELEAEYQQIDWISTGSASLDFAIHPSGKGIPTHNIIELPGLSSSGKTVILDHLLKNGIDQNGIGVLFDVEDAFDPELNRNIEVDMDKLMVISPSIKEKDGTVTPLSFTEIFQRIEYVIDETHRQYGRDKLLVMGVDSIGAMPFSQDLAEGAPKATQGAQAKEIGIWLKRIRAKVTNSNTLLVLINQMYSNITSMPTATPYISKGGKAIGYQSQIRVMFHAVDSKAGKIFDSKDKIIGARLSFTVIKNRISRSFTTGTVDWLFGEDGIPKLQYHSGLLNYLVGTGKLLKDKGKVVVGKDSYRCKVEGSARKPIFVASEETIEKMLKEHPELLER